MNTSLLTNEQVQAISTEIDSQLRDLAGTDVLRTAVIRGETAEDLPHAYTKQLESIAGATKLPAKPFLKQFFNTARNDLCNPGGTLYSQWQKWGNVENPEVIRTLAGVLAGMGVTGHLIPILVVPLAVIVLHIGIKAICEEAD